MTPNIKPNTKPIKSFTGKAITIFRATVRVTGSMAPFFFGPYRFARGDAEVDKIKFVSERLKSRSPETIDIQLVPAIQLEDGQVAVIVPVGSNG